jgi:hypothetical protein
MYDMATLNKFFTNLLILGLSVNIVLYLFGAFNFDPQVQIPGSLSTMTSWFNLTPFNLLFTGATAAIVGVAALLLRQGTYAIYAMLLAALGMVISPVSAFILAVPNLLGMLLPAATNPNPTLFPINPIIVVVSLIFAFAAYWFIFGLVIQRDLG